MDELLLHSKEIIEQAITDYKPGAIFIMFSGGNDSRAAYEVARTLRVPLTHFVHGNTRTGIKETTEYATKIGLDSGLSFLVADAGSAYEDYVMRKGFFGRGQTAHAYAYHVIKATTFRKASSLVRLRRRNFNVLMINGARREESYNRSRNLTSVTNVDPAAKRNIWVNIIHHWSKAERDDFLVEAKTPINPVTELLCRSGECLCGTMQTDEERKEASFWFPEWGKWVDDLEKRVTERFPWKWGESCSKAKMEAWRKGMDFMPACTSCQLKIQGE